MNDKFIRLAELTKEETKDFKKVRNKDLVKLALKVNNADVARALYMFMSHIKGGKLPLDKMKEIQWHAQSGDCGEIYEMIGSYVAPENKGYNLRAIIISGGVTVFIAMSSVFVVANHEAISDVISKMVISVKQFVGIEVPNTEEPVEEVFKPVMQEKEKSEVPEGMVEVEKSYDIYTAINFTPTFPEGTLKPGNLRIENLKENQFDMVVKIKDGNELIYESPRLKPGDFLEYDVLMKKYSEGMYNVLASFYFYSGDILIQSVENYNNLTLYVN